MSHTQDIFWLALSMIVGVISLHYGYQFFFNTEPFLQKMIEKQKIKEGSCLHKYYKNKKNMIFHKVNGIGCIIGGILCILFPILKLLNYIK
jgi:uncharacterized membrane protein HdeD (DUF308 family)